MGFPSLAAPCLNSSLVVGHNTPGSVGGLSLAVTHNTDLGMVLSGAKLRKGGQEGADRDPLCLGL